MAEMDTTNVGKNVVRVKVHSRGYHDGSLYDYDIPLHRVMIDIMDDVDGALSVVDFDRQIECDVDDDECFDRAYHELGKDQDKAIDLMYNVLSRWDEKVQLPYLFWYVNACDEYDACYYDVYVSDVGDLMRWWNEPINRDIIIDVLYTQYQFSIYDTDGLVYFDPRVRTSIHTVLVPNDAFKPLWHRNDLDRAIDLVRKILIGTYFEIPWSLDREETYEDDVYIV
jgi:hypothetical protein